ncbi:MAG: rRNA maturation RNase YbeY [Gammaproteobacteria bacterium]|jgi:probable rRNA maturation factor|nr:rRNA maturation RNase YbeY [Gammaproteobacteria bacterium]
MAIQLDVQLAVQDANIPSVSEFKAWAQKIPSPEIDSNVCLRIVGENEVRELNKRYRNIDKPTNVLSFGADIPEELGLNILGDVVICASVVFQEAVDQEKKLTSHWAHLLVHGILHLQGFGHENDSQAEIMEALEINILEQLGMGNPY